MGNHLYEVAKENLKNKKRAAIVLISGIILFILFFSYWVSTDTTLIWPWYFIVPILILMFYFLYYFGSKIVGQKDPILKEMERLKGLNTGADIEEIEKLELKELIPKYREDDLV